MLSPSEPYEEFGCEDPRVTEIDGTYYLTYSGLGPDARPALPGHLDRPVHLGEARAAVPGLQHLRAARQTASPTPWSKAGGILATPIDGRYLMYFGEGSIYYAWSDDLIHWTPCPQDEPIMVPTPRRHVR